LILTALLAWPGCRKSRPAEERAPGGEVAAPVDPAATPTDPEVEDDSDGEDDEVSDRRGRGDGRERPRDRNPLGDIGYVDFDEDEDSADADKEGVVIHDPALASPGYTLYTSMPFATARLIDAEGAVVKEWSEPQSKEWSRAELDADGNLLIVGIDPREKDAEADTPNAFGYLMRMTWEGDVIWKKTLATHHDADITPDGYIVSLDDCVRSVPDFGPDVLIRDNHVIRLTLDGEKVDQRSLYDVFTSNPELVTVELPKKVFKEGGAKIDIFHANSVEWMRFPELVPRHEIYGLDNVIVSSRLQDTTVIFNWTTGKLLWAWGRGQTEGQHEATVLANGNILIFDNGMRRKWSRVIELDPLTNKIVWEYKGDPPDSFYSAARGTSEPLPNGNVLVGLSNSGAGVEVTRDGKVVWRFLNPDRNEDGKRAVIRLRRYSVDFIKAILERHRTE